MLDPTAITFFIINVIEAVLIIVGNSLAIFVFWTQTFRQRRACLLLINLSAADLLVGVAESLILAAKKIPIRGQEGDAIRLLPFVVFASCASVLFMALISLERLCAVFWPVRHRLSSRKIYVCSIVTVWFIGLVFGVLCLLSQYFKGMNRSYVSAPIPICLFVSFLVTCMSYVIIRRRLICTPRDENNGQHAEPLWWQQHATFQNTFRCFCHFIFALASSSRCLPREKLLPEVYSSSFRGICEFFAPGKFHGEPTCLQLQDASI